MKQLFVALAVVVGLAAVPATGHAHDAYDDTQSNPIRLVAYALNPVGYAIEWTVMRPIHFVVSQPNLERIFGHTPHEDAFGDYTPYNPDDQE